HRLEYSHSWRYLGRDDIPFDAPDPTDRVSEAEDAIRQRVEEVWKEESPVEWAPTAVLTGLDAAEFAARVLPRLEALGGVVVEVTGERPRYRELTGDPRIEVTTVESPDPDWFDLGVVVTIDGRRLPFGKLFTALSRGRRKML